MKKWKWLIVVLGLIVAFSGGWLVAKVQDADRRPFNDILVNRWTDGVVMLANQHGEHVEFTRPETLRALVLGGLDGYSIVLGKRYDDLPKRLKVQVAFHLPAAYAIAHAAAWPEAKTDKRNLLIFLACLRAEKQHGGSVKHCAASKRKQLMERNRSSGRSPARSVKG